MKTKTLTYKFKKGEEIFHRIYDELSELDTDVDWSTTIIDENNRRIEIATKDITFTIKIEYED